MVTVISTPVKEKPQEEKSIDAGRSRGKIIKNNIDMGSHVTKTLFLDRLIFLVFILFLDFPASLSRGLVVVGFESLNEVTGVADIQYFQRLFYCPGLIAFEQRLEHDKFSYFDQYKV
jgi:hypothetical protein